MGEGVDDSVVADDGSVDDGFVIADDGGPTIVVNVWRVNSPLKCNDNEHTRAVC